MKVNINICDKCGKEAREDNDGDAFSLYETIKIEFADYYSNSKWQQAHKAYYLCEDCLMKIGAKKKTKEATHDPDIKDRLFDIFADIITECQNS